MYPYFWYFHHVDTLVADRTRIFIDNFIIYCSDIYRRSICQKTDIFFPALIVTNATLVFLAVSFYYVLL